MKDIVDSATDVAITVQQGDLDIASDHLKISAWLVALSTAALYFCFNELGKLSVQGNLFVSVALFTGYILIGNLFGFSFLSAYKFRQAHLQFCAYARNLIVAYKIQRSTFVENLDIFKRELMIKNLCLFGHSHNLAICTQS